MEMFSKLCTEFDVHYIPYEDSKKYEKGVDYLFTDIKDFRINESDIMRNKKKNTRICLLQNPFKDSVNIKSFTIINKPLFSLNFSQVVSQKDNMYMYRSMAENDFEAPEAEILIVDDNETNLVVAQALLEPLHMNIDTAANGKEALQMVKEKRYHLIFMDHMMPYMDGVETTQFLRGMNGEYYQQVPIIVLTANAVVGAKETFIEAGMNDFVTKPINMKAICKIIRKWLPSELIKEQQ